MRLVQPEPQPDPDQCGRTALCQAWLQVETILERHVGKALTARAYWRALLELYMADTEGRSLYSSCFLTGEAASNVHRRSVRLAELGALTRHQDAADHRRVDLRLTPAIRTQIEQVLDAILALHREKAREMGGFWRAPGPERSAGAS